VVCVVDGGWGEWKVSECSVTCGEGVQTLTRACDNPRAFCRGKQCTGPVAVTRRCNTQPCPGMYAYMYVCMHVHMYCIILYALHDIAVFSDWSEFSACTRTCGGGTQFRNRTRVSGTCKPDDLVESRDCNTQCCRGKNFTHEVNSMVVIMT